MQHFSLVGVAVMMTAMAALAGGFTPPDIQRRFEYKLSFKGPHMTFKDGTIPFWEHAGSAIPSNDQVRLTPSIKSQRGRVWSKHTAAHDDWEIDVAVRVSGRGRIGADGLAIWYTDKPGQEGPVFGANDNWVGMGVFLDSFDNDGQQNNPYVMVMTNDGTKTYDHDRDGITQQLGGCLRDFRNKPFPVHLKIEYYQKIITIYYHGGLNNDLSTYEICTRVENVELPKNGYFGVSAATGGLADDHDVVSFLTHSLIDPKSVNIPAVPSDEQKKYDKEYEEFVKQLEQEKENYRKEHPEAAKKELDETRVLEDESERQFRNILDVQNSIYAQIRSLDSKMAEIVGRQERMFSMLSVNNVQPINNNNNQQQLPNQGANGQNVVKREEIAHLINQQAEIFKMTRDIYSSISEVHRKTNAMYDRPVPQQISATPNVPVAQNQMDSNLLNQMNNDMRSFRLEMNNALRNQGKCPETTSNCLTSFYFMVIIGAQTVLLLVYFMIKSRAESHAKKFY